MYKTKRKGFTLIELLIVIVIIGVLATAVLSAINPIEQVRKAQDAGMRSDSAEVLNAIERFYTSFRRFPWCSDAVTGTCTRTNADVPTVPVEADDGDNGTPVALADGSVQDWVTAMITVEELKPEFANRDTLSSLFVFWDGQDSVRICFNPISGSYDAQAQWTNEGIPRPDSQARNDDADYVCVPE